MRGEREGGERRGRGESERSWTGFHCDAACACVGSGWPAGVARGLIAYEPVWAIGTGRHADPSQVQAMHAFIRGEIARQDARIGDSLLILYGGGIKPCNAAELFSQQDVDGGLIGGASLVADDFLAIARATV